MQRYLNILLVPLLFISPFALSDEDAQQEESNATKSPPEFSSMDTNEDGQISKEEFDQFRKPEGSEDEEESENESGLSAFSSFDKNKDGFVSESELAAHAKYSNPGNGTGELKNKPDGGGSEARSNSSNGNSGGKGNSGGNKGGGNKGGSDKGGNKGGKGKDK
ncbi:hypothetical protein TW78_15080 [Vibrio coralliilyticus]|uniref:Uncharacterized protein n=1 Tax=Vibrio coralliilyticus TaxID=190893 RepID=A0A837GDN6_9VIBR|nr:EF-hand domain-containing protein [Vibrio coralliilyticus]KJY70789.1 hypothetical protein TW78_15080 [Vibrio coralliilyticus]QOU31228.1 EF-hand domain-containing protein [Vibrio coralliilyticus]